jgi:hypothetical protein
MLSVQPTWALELPLQQQSVLLLACRGPDGIAKFHPCKEVVRAYRATCLVAAKYGRTLGFGEHADTFMSLKEFADEMAWGKVLKQYFDNMDDLPHHYQMHLLHGAEILGYKHPDERFRERWKLFYLKGVHDMHLNVETEAEMDKRLSDWGQRYWGVEYEEG